MPIRKDLHVHGDLAKNVKTMLNSKLKREEKPSFREKSEKLAPEGAGVKPVST